ncbi:MAG: hypothetical protein ACK47B_24780 [Armatimonadota bacterium]
MSAYTILLGWDLPTQPPRGGEEAREIAYGSHGIPAFWMTLFDPASIVTAVEAVEDEDGHDEPEEYPYLVTDAAAALERSRKRWPSLAQAIGQEYAALFQSWHQHLSANGSRYFHCDPWDYCAISGDYDSYRDELLAALTAFETEPWERSGWLVKRHRLTPAWAKLLENFDERENRELVVNALCGHGGPWDGSERGG